MEFIGFSPAGCKTPARADESSHKPTTQPDQPPHPTATGRAMTARGLTGDVADRRAARGSGELRCAPTEGAALVTSRTNK